MANGQLPKSQLAEAFNASGPRVYLRKDAAASWNSFALWMAGQSRYGTPTFNGADSAYRSLDRQRYYWALYQSGRGNLAAYPGRSNHGEGIAGDLNDAAQQALRDGHGKQFGWAKTEAMNESWHWNFVGGFKRPDPGPDRRNPILRRGSGGPGQDEWVERAQKLLVKHGAQVKPDGDFGLNTKRAVAAFQKERGLKPDGIIGGQTWDDLRAKPEDRPKLNGKDDDS